MTKTKSLIAEILTETPQGLSVLNTMGRVYSETNDFLKTGIIGIQTINEKGLTLLLLIALWLDLSDIRKTFK